MISIRKPPHSDFATPHPDLATHGYLQMSGSLHLRRNTAVV